MEASVPPRECDPEGHWAAARAEDADEEAEEGEGCGGAGQCAWGGDSGEGGQLDELPGEAEAMSPEACESLLASRAALERLLADMDAWLHADSDDPAGGSDAAPSAYRERLFRLREAVEGYEAALPQLEEGEAEEEGEEGDGEGVAEEQDAEALRARVAQLEATVAELEAELASCRAGHATP